MIPIRDVLARLESLGLLATTGPATDLAVAGISDDSRKVRAGDLYGPAFIQAQSDGVGPGMLYRAKAAGFIEAAKLP